MFSRIQDFLYARRGGMALAATSGALYFVGFCGFDQFYLAWICLVPILWALDDPSLGGWEALLLPWIFGLVTHMGGYSWIVGMLHDFGHLPTPLALLGFFLLCVGQSTLLAAWGWLVWYLCRRLGWPVVWVAPVLMVLCEWLWPALFPSYLSNSQYRQIVFIQSLDLWGPLGLTFILVLASAVLYQTAAWRFRGGGAPRAGWIVLALLVVGNFAYGVAALANTDDTVSLSDRRIKVGLVQTNMGIYAKRSEPQEGLRRHREQSLEIEPQGVELIVWPESGYGFGIPTELDNLKEQVMGEVSTALLFGGVRIDRSDGTRRVFNTAFLLDSDGNVQGTYDKTYLLAFGEYLPLGETFPFLYDLSPHTSHFTRGTRIDPLELDGVRYGVLICYEDVLPAFVRGVMQQDVDVLVNITNDAWFGKSREPLIHLALATFRAVEHRRFLVRSTNTGISAFVDPAGRIIEPTPIFARANPVHTIAALEGMTLYGRVGDWVAWLCAVVALVWLRKPLVGMFTRVRARFRRRPS